MKRKIMIMTNPEDYHAFAVDLALRKKGAESMLWVTSDYPTHSTETVEYDTARREIWLGKGKLKEPGVVWNRRPSLVMNDTILHEADRVFARNSCRDFRDSLYLLLSEKSFWVNPFQRSHLVDHKIYQHEIALRSALLMPKTLYGNDPERIREFIRSNGGRIAFKPLSPGAVWRNGEHFVSAFTKIISEEDLVEDELLMACPGIYQELVPKAYELRVTAIGNKLFAAKINSQQTEHGQNDWRNAYDELSMEMTSIPGSVQDSILTLMKNVGIVFGCFDFIVTPDQKHVFLEVNEMGQFLFVEKYTRFPLLDAFCEFLMQARVDFDWHESKSRINLDDIDDAVMDALACARNKHVRMPRFGIVENAV